MKHETVLKNEVIEYLNINPSGIYVDGTLGGGGHSKAILDMLTDGHLYVFDQDIFAINYAKERLKEYKNITYINSNFRNIENELKKLGVKKIDGVILDLGMSSFQIDDESRGFSYISDARLDMRMNQSATKDASYVCNNYTEEELTNIFYLYGEEKNSRRIAREIIKNRPIEYTHQLVEITDRINYKVKGHSAKRVFQALRIEVNDELKALEEFLEQSLNILNKEGRLAFLTFHSLEDRIVKHFFKEHSDKPLPKGVPMAGVIEGELEVITRKPIYPSKEEMKYNSRSRSAKLRVARKK